ncbi:MAG: hypothetical protein KDD41_12450 [Flavobacteriales bacterium]|nr:hypothetical protein [Flavobacteriales bacterium]
MIRIYTLLILVLIGSASFAQNYDLILKQENVTAYSAANKNFSVYTFSAPQAIGTEMEQQIVKELMEKDHVKSAVLNATKDRITITLRSELTLKDINTVLNPISVLLINEKETPKAILDKINTANNL